MKTRREILESGLPKEVAEKAIKNIIDYWKDGAEDYLNREVEESVEGLLFNSFLWEKSPEGLKYWMNVQNTELCN